MSLNSKGQIVSTQEVAGLYGEELLRDYEQKQLAIQKQKSEMQPQTKATLEVTKSKTAPTEGVQFDFGEGFGYNERRLVNYGIDE